MGDFITKRSEDINQWYNDLVLKGGLADHSDVRGCMVIKPYGYTLWENMRDVLDRMIKETGHTNAYFPLFVPKSLFEAEEKNAEGFAKECAIVTHYRLKNDPNNKGKLIVDPEAKLEEELVVRPTSEAVIWNTYRKWISSYRDLPLLINQWANVVRWEMRTKLFLRTAEFLWQEGHTAHATKAEAIEETEKMLGVYAEFVETFLAIPVFQGKKTESERFAGADDTLCIEALMQDGKALQAGTSHFLGQNFAKAFDVKYQSEEGQEEYVWATSWGVSTRLIGALIMTHSDDNGLIMPPKVAPFQVVFVPFLHEKNKEQNEVLIAKCYEFGAELKKRGIRFMIDKDTTKRPGFKFAEHELKGIPIRVVFGPRDIENNMAEVARRDNLTKENISQDNLIDYIEHLLGEIHTSIYQRALTHRTENTRECFEYEDFKKKIEVGGFVIAHWDGSAETEEKIKEETKATIRCIPFDLEQTSGTCIYSGKPSQHRVLFARAH
jgi:prolyl-tRNA synthetase